MPCASSKVPNARLTSIVVSASRGTRRLLLPATLAPPALSSGPSPPRLRGVRAQARWTSAESHDTNATRAPRATKSSMRSEKARISVGHTKVKSFG